MLASTMLASRMLPPPRLSADIYETPDGDAYVLEIPVPGLDPNQINVEATPELVTVRTKTGESENGQERRRYLQQEREQAPMSRVFEFPSEIDPDNINATLRAGMLELRVPKAAASRRRTIPLKTG